MTTLAVIPDREPSEDCLPDRRRGPEARIDHSGLQGGEEALGNRVTKAVARRAQRADDGPADDPARVRVRRDCEVALAFRCSDVYDIVGPQPIRHQDGRGLDPMLRTPEHWA